MPNPKIKIEPTSFGLRLEKFTVLSVAVMFGLTIYYYGFLPDNIPHHFNASVEPDAWGGKWVLLVIPIVGLALYYFLKWTSRHPNIGNYPVKITETNAPRQYQLAIRMMQALNLTIQLLLLCILVMMIRTGMGGSTFLIKLVMYGLVAVLFGVLGTYFYKALQKE
ncbi:MAG: hypothetical protein DHS20C18_54140 [Saprospiraceae bacterium]|nr:MAG: hypothetical protein DHS20C18_54140 [Saprospiraceae bacterium]